MEALYAAGAFRASANAEVQHEELLDRIEVLEATRDQQAAINKKQQAAIDLLTKNMEVLKRDYSKRRP